LPEVYLLRPSHRPGLEGDRCSEACPTGAFTFGEEENFKDIIAKAEILHPEYKTKPGSII